MPETVSHVACRPFCMDRPRAASVGGLHSPLIAVSAMAPYTLGDVGDELGAGELATS